MAATMKASGNGIYFKDTENSVIQSNCERKRRFAVMAQMPTLRAGAKSPIRWTK
jgi:hypothetical protein